MSKVEARDLEYCDDELVLSGVLVSDTSDMKPSGTRPGIVVFHDSLGLGLHALERAHALARLGYIVLAADLYGQRAQARDPSHAMQLMSALRTDTRRWRARAQAALAVLGAQSEVDPQRIAAVGYCFGGSTALELARHGAPIAAVACFHGLLQTAAPVTPGSTRTRVLVCTGADDPLVPAEQVVAFLDEMRQANVDCQTLIYSGARHAFTMPTADQLGLPAMAYDLSADRRSWAALQSFFSEVLHRS